jgi:hypothetical protein
VPACRVVRRDCGLPRAGGGREAGDISVEQIRQYDKIVLLDVKRRVVVTSALRAKSSMNTGIFSLSSTGAASARGWNHPC